MSVEKKYNYYLVQFDDEKTYWYRSSDLLRVGSKVIVPVSNNGKWKIGVITESHRFKRIEVPYPINETKGIVKKAGWFDNEKVRRHNELIEKSKYPPFDISVATVNTKQGPVRYITCRQERNIIETEMLHNKTGLILIENYPPASFDEIPSEAKAILRKKLKKIQDAQRRLDKEEELLGSNEFDEEMEDLDQYN